MIGAGPAGLTAAYLLSGKGYSVDVYEASGQVGGLAKSFILWNQTVDLGPHRFFTKNKMVDDLWLSMAKNDYRNVKRLTRIYYNGKFFYYPLKPFNALFTLGPVEALRCVLSYLIAKINSKKKPHSFEEWVTQRFGKRLFKIFFKSYSEKLWGIPTSQLDADFAAQRIRKLSLSQAILNAFSKSELDHKTLADTFKYPTRGAGMIYENMKSAIESMGNRININKPVRKVIVKDDKASGLELEDGEIKNYDYIISTMPLTHLVTRIDDVPEEVKIAADKLKFRNTILVYLLIDSDHLFPDQWLYIHSPELKTGRITNFRNWVPELNGNERNTIVAMEYWCYSNDKIWSEGDEEIISLAKREIQSTGLLKDHSIEQGKVVRINKCYPVYESKYRQKLEPVEKYLDKIQNLSVIGRYGAFKYNNQDHSIYMGILAAENISQGTRHDLWNVNTDYEEYQESH